MKQRIKESAENILIEIQDVTFGCLILLLISTFMTTYILLSCGDNGLKYFCFGALIIFVGLWMMESYLKRHCYFSSHIRKIIAHL